MGQRLKLIRKALGLTQEQLAQRLGVGKTALSMVETGKARLISPLVISILLTAVLYPLSLLTEGGNIFLTLIVKSIIFFIIFGCYIQLTGEYDIIGKTKSIINKNKE